MIANDSPFRSAHSALRWAHGISGRGVYDRPVTSRKEKREPGVRVEPKFAGLTPMENHAQAAWITKVADQCESLTPLERVLLAAYFTVPNTHSQVNAKADAINQVAAVVGGHYSYGQEFIRDTVRRYVGEAHQDNAAWAATLSKSKRAVRDCRQGIIRRLRNTMDNALDKLDIAMEERGYVAA